MDLELGNGRVFWTSFLERGVSLVMMRFLFFLSFHCSRGSRGEDDFHYCWMVKNGGFSLIFLDFLVAVSFFPLLRFSDSGGGGGLGLREIFVMTWRHVAWRK
ncbi:hypothetical protein BC829DRAFT_387006 [Chytridium lagenaria]|nr:hypothetical protein BC829DRAFT_387006 [Chytridium lagenaria]